MQNLGQLVAVRVVDGTRFARIGIGIARWRRDQHSRARSNL
ncbi:MAG: hypothetical protein ACBR50_00860 [Microcoleus sp.]